MVSHNTGDSAKEEIKEKREWPPRPLPTSSSSIDSKPKSDETAKSPLPSVIKKTAEEPKPPEPTSPRDAITSSVSAPVSLAKVPEPPADRVDPAPEPQPSSPPRAAAPLPAESPTRLRQSTKPLAKKTMPITPTKTPARTSTTKPPPPSYFNPPPSTMKPLKPQLTGQSTTSTTSTVRAKSRVGMSAPSTPSRSKTPSAVARPKTPSGLYAPTAASLAKARNAPPVPTPTRKATTSAQANAVLERLSKPTAASASKARAPAPAVTQSPAKAKPVSIRGGAPARPIAAAVKPRVGLAPLKLKQERDKKELASKVKATKATGNVKAVAIGAAAAAPVEVVKSEDEVHSNGALAAEPSHDEVVDHPEGGYEEQPSFISEQSFTTDMTEHIEPEVKSDSDEIESYDDAYVDENETLDSEHIRVSLAGADASFAISTTVGAIGEIEKDTPYVLPASPEPLSGDEKLEENEAPDNDSTNAVDTTVSALAEVEEPTPIVTEPTNGVLHVEDHSTFPVSEKSIAPVDELESMVHMLELGIPKRPPSAVSSVLDPDTAGSIPDEE